MAALSFKRHRFPADVIRHAVWLYFRFTLSFRDVDELLAQRGIEVSYETIRCWTIKFGPQIARNLRRKRPAPSPRWHLDEMVCNVGGQRMYLWRAVDDEGEVLDLVMQRRRDNGAALRLLKRRCCQSNANFSPFALQLKGPGEWRNGDDFLQETPFSA
jgi:putative transposase